MKCKQCGEENGDAKRTCSRCGAFLEGYTLNNVTGEYGYRGADGGWYKSEEEYRAHCSGATQSPCTAADAGSRKKRNNSTHVNQKRIEIMTKRDFILQAMLQLAGTGQYNDQFENKRLVKKEKRIFDDAVKLADCAESYLWAGDVSNPSSVFEEENNVKKNYEHKAPCVRYVEGWACEISPAKRCDGCAQYVPRTEQENKNED